LETVLGDETGPGDFTAFDVASDPAQSSPAQKGEQTDFFLCGMPQGDGLVELGRFLRMTSVTQSWMMHGPVVKEQVCSFQSVRLEDFSLVLRTSAWFLVCFGP
jgi:hypothetical protein